MQQVKEEVKIMYLIWYGLMKAYGRACHENDVGSEIN